MRHQSYWPMFVYPAIVAALITTSYTIANHIIKAQYASPYGQQTTLGVAVALDSPNVPDNVAPAPCRLFTGQPRTPVPHASDTDISNKLINGLFSPAVPGGIGD
jgi:hypothetical protein